MVSTFNFDADSIFHLLIFYLSVSGYLWLSVSKVRSHTSVLGTLSKLFSSLLSSLPPTVGASLLTISLPDVTKEAVEGLLVLYREEWGEAKVRREVVELADMLAMPLCNI